MQSQLINSSTVTKRSIFKTLLVAGTLALGTLATAQAAPLLEYKYEGYLASSTGENQPLAKVEVGGSNVQIGGFGVYGRASTAMNIGFVIFDLNDLQNPAFLSGPQQVGASPSSTWYSINAPFTMLSGHTYAMGVVADTRTAFGWANGAFMTPTPTVSNGLTLLSQTAGVKVGACSTGGQFGGAWCNAGSSATLQSFLTEPYPDVFNTTIGPQNKLSLQIAPVPEPSEYAMLLVGLAVIGFIGNRRKQKMA
jgi:hypothetical protein